MDKRNKIIVSIVGIFIILLALVGITYGYFLTQIQGNTNDNSVYITTANLRLVYDDNESLIRAENIEPGSTTYTKTFTVTNEGNAVVDYEVYIENVINDLVHEEDLLMFITCESNIEGNTCNEYGDGTVTDNVPTFGTSIYPTVNSKVIENSISPATATSEKEVHTYKLYLQFKDDGTDQSVDMGKAIQGHVQIYDPKDVIAITGTVTGHDSSYYVEMHSDVKTSEIASDGTYIFYGVKAEEHTIYIKSKTSTGIEEIGSSTINVTKGENASISSDASSIVINDKSEEATVNITIPSTKDSITLVGTTVMVNPYNKGTLAYEIYKNKALVEGYTITDSTYTSTGTTTNKTINELTTVTGIADGTNLEDNGMFSAEDDYGTSYIYRGSVRNNYVDFAGFTWRIVRINGDGTVRLILNGTLDKTYQRLSDGTVSSTVAGSTSAFNSSKYDNASVGYTYGQIGVTGDSDTKTAYDLTHEYTGDKTNTEDKTGQSRIKQTVDTFYKTYLLDDYHIYISDTLFCGDKSLARSGIGNVMSQLGYDDNKTYYAATERLYYNNGTIDITEAKPTLKCVTDKKTLTEEQKAYSRYTVSGEAINGIKTNDDLIYPIALLSADELVMSGAFRITKNQQYYLYNSNTLSYVWWVMTPYSYYTYAREFSSYSDASFYQSPALDNAGVRPVINLGTNVLWKSGDGTEESPYTVKLPNNIITFTVDTSEEEFNPEGIIKTYYAEEGMTFGEWVNSKYNIDNYKILDDSVYLENLNMFIVKGEEGVGSETVIDSNVSYRLVWNA